VQFVHESLGTAALVEEFIDGRELYVGVIGNERLRAFPVWEIRSRRCRAAPGTWPPSA